MSSRIPADPQAAEPVQMGERALHDPTLGTEAGAVLNAPAGNHRLHPESPDEATVLVVVVSTVSEDDVWPAPGTSTLAPHWWDRFK